jgi:hypothetical protein
MHPALNLNDILCLVMAHLESDPESLCSAMCVNATWAHEAAYLLWRSPPIVALVAAAPERRAFYARNARELFVAEDAPGAAAQVVPLSGISLPLLRCLHVHLPSLPPPLPPPSSDAHLRNALHLQHPLGQTLRELRLTCDSGTTALMSATALLKLLDATRRACPLLEALSLGQCCPPLHLHDVLALLHQWPRLCSIECLSPSTASSSSDSDSSKNLLLHLAERPRLRRLGLGQSLSADVLRHLALQILRPFQDLRHLRLRLVSSALSSLVALFCSNASTEAVLPPQPSPPPQTSAASLRELVLHVDDADAPPLPPLVAAPFAPHLHTLELHCYAAIRFAAHDFVQLGRLTQLRRLVMRAHPKDKHSWFRLRVKGRADNDMVAALVRNLPRLRHLCLYHVQ